MSRPRWQPIYFGLGSNLNEPPHQLQRAVRALADLDGVRLYAVSSVVWSAPVDGSDQPDYFNAVAAGLTGLEPLDLLAKCQQIELSQGRDHTAARWSARPLDIDLLSLGQTVHSTEQLTLPHDQLAQRAFVLQPLAQIAAHAWIPGLGPVNSLLRDVDLTGVRAHGKLFPDGLPNGLS